ncbi:Inositolphosphorylceramide-B hydroxylase, partial [Atractiella rhizophila]
MAVQKTSSRNRIYTATDVKKHNSLNSLWVTVKGKVYDLTEFAPDHPGGVEYLEKFAGQDATEAMQDPEEHLHSDSAYELLADYQVGILGTEDTLVRDDIIIDENFEPEETDIQKDFEKHQFLDLNKPLLLQILNANYSKEYYLKEVHQPRHLAGRSALMFGPWWIEWISLTPWYVVPMFWLPIVAYLFQLSMKQQVEAGVSGNLSAAFNITLYCFFVGVFLWTVIEYAVHRFLFHVDNFLPDHPYAFTLHFLLHGVHHALPMDRYRLVMPPPLFAVLQYPWTQFLAYNILPVWMANGVISGAFGMYVVYDTMHYALHHTKLPAYVKKQKAWHMKHHWLDYDA